MGHGKIGTETTIFHIHGNGYLRLIHGSKTHENGVVLSSVLCGSRLSANVKGKMSQGFAGTPECRRAHACHHSLIGSWLSHGDMTARIEGV